MNRREFLQQLSCAFAVAGVACAIPLEVHAEEPEIDVLINSFEGIYGCEVISMDLPSEITGMAKFRDVLVITTRDDGVWAIKETSFLIRAHRAHGRRISIEPYWNPAFLGEPSYDDITLEKVGYAFGHSRVEIWNDGWLQFEPGPENTGPATISFSGADPIPVTIPEAPNV